MSVKLLTEHHLEFLSLKGGCKGSWESTLVKNVKLVEISCRGSYGLMYWNSENWICLPGKTEVKHCNFVEFISPATGYFRETSKSQNTNLISSTPYSTLGAIQIKVYSLSN